MSHIEEITVAVHKEIELYGKISYRFDEYFCEITRQMDEYNEYYKTESDQEWQRVMRVYMCSPDCKDPTTCEWYIAIRVPGATRGHLKVEPHNGYWRVTDIKFYDETAIIGISNIGCFKPEILTHITDWIGTIIDFGEYNPKT